MKFLLLSLFFVCSASSFSIANEESDAKKDKRDTIDRNNCKSDAKALSTKLYGLAMKIQDIQKAYVREAIVSCFYGIAVFLVGSVAFA